MMHVTCIHGFLGQASDWDSLFPEPEFPEIEFNKLSLFSPPSSQLGIPGSTLAEWGEWINLQAQKLKAPRVIVGYSLGGRIALQALCTQPALWQKAILISTHPGFSATDPHCKHLRQQRLISDAQWAKRWISEPWEKVLEDWNAQSVFQKDQKDFFREKKHYDVHKLAQILTGCSLGFQADWRPVLRKSLQCPVLWVTGEKDRRFSTLAHEVSNSHPLIQSLSIPHAGHRVWLDQPEHLKVVIKNFLFNIEFKNK